MNTSAAATTNRRIWDTVYRKGGGILRYPNDVFVTLVSRRLNPAVQTRVLDFGFGSGNNLLHLAHSGFQCWGVEVSAAAHDAACARLEQAGVCAGLTVAEGPLPYEDASFDAVIAWQVLYYNDRDGVEQTLSELHRVLAPGGKLLATFARPGDMLVDAATRVAPHRYVVSGAVPAQEGAQLHVPEDSAEIERLFARFDAIEIGHFEWSLGTCGSHWLVWAEKAAKECEGR